MIAFDMVKVGDSYGVVYEMINARSLVQEIAGHPENVDQYAEMIADTLLKLHYTEFEEGALADSRDRFKDDIRATLDAGVYKPNEADRLYKLVDDIPVRNTFIHHDFHPGNIMLQDGEIVLIDVEDSGLGHPVIDLASMYLVYVTAAGSGWTKKNFGIDGKTFERIWDVIIRKYFNTDDKAEIAEINRILYGYSLIKYLRGIATSDTVPNMLRKPLGSSAKKKLLSMADSLHAIP
jgi:uncharacterized protein (TIGR02172 family)